MNWTVVRNRDGEPSKYAIRCSPWKVCRVMVCGVEWYEVWRDGVSPFVARYHRPDEAKGYCRESAANQLEGV